MKLYEVPRNSWVKPISETKAPPGARTVLVGEKVKFHHIDGMYSYCHDEKHNVVHLLAWQEVEIINE